MKMHCEIGTIGAGAEPGQRCAPRGRERGVALIITLILLSIITFLAVAFLVLSQRNRGAVSTHTDQKIAEMAADTAVESFAARVMAAMLAFTNAQLFDTMVSTNFINPVGFNPGLNHPTNVNFEYTLNNAPLNLDQSRQNLLNLLYDPRPPVYLPHPLYGTNEFRYYLDLNRNGVHDRTGFFPELDAQGQPVGTNLVWHIGDPEWVGILEYPDRPHSGNNRFIARYAFFAVPISRTLDVNRIHNQTLNLSLDPGTDGYFRNQGVGTWEINLAAFLTDLNSNVWTLNDYTYNRPFNLAQPNLGIAFNDALAFVRYRYRGDYKLLNSASLMFADAPLLSSDLVDLYSDGPLHTGLAPVPDNDAVESPWAGADYPQHLFTSQDFFDRRKLALTGQPSGFVERLYQATTYSLSSYDRETYYRLLSQLGTESVPETEKINVNYRNVDDAGRVVANLETQLQPWDPGQFFNSAADRLIRTNTTTWFRENPGAFVATYGMTEPFTLTNIPVSIRVPGVDSEGNAITNDIRGYTPAVHRLLQVAANIYAASGEANSPHRVPLTANLSAPPVFRPIFRRDANNNVFITGYVPLTKVTNQMVINLMTTNVNLMIDLSLESSRTNLPLIGATNVSIPLAEEPMVAGIPLVIGAKKGFPNFNKFVLENTIRVTRKLRFQRLPGQPIHSTNQIYALSLSNAFGLQAWNSYSVAYPRNLELYAVAVVNVVVSNELGVAFYRLPVGGLAPMSHRFVQSRPVMTIPTNSWAGYTPQSGSSFIVPLVTNYNILSYAAYQQVPAATPSGWNGSFVGTADWDPPNRFPIPRWQLGLRSQVRFLLYDREEQRIIDYVNLDSTEEPLDLIATARGGAPCNTGMPGSANPDPGILWCTNRINNPNNAPMTDDVTMPTYGIMNQIAISMGLPVMVSEGFWRSYNSTTDDRESSIPRFVNRLFDNANSTSPADCQFETPFNPTRTFRQYVRWEANDPLVHYTVEDLTDLLVNVDRVEWDTDTRSPMRRLSGRNALSDHYRPWGGNPENPAETKVPTRFNPAVKDPWVTRSDDWDFPTTKLANIGWLGQVHRGTPWQTIYLKSVTETNGTWQPWSGNRNPFDAWNARPASDRLLFDVFTAAPHENATRGQLSVNQSGLAAWSAVLSGVVVTTNAATGEWTVIEPAAAHPAVKLIVDGINATRASTNRFTGENEFPFRQFAHVGDVLATPELTDRSPFLNLQGAVPPFVNDKVYERIPQQIMSLLTLDHAPRFLVYAYGQRLRPAEGSVITTQNFFQLCTNYVPTAEAAIRAVVRVEGLNWTNSTPRVVIEQFNLLPPD